MRTVKAIKILLVLLALLDGYIMLSLLANLPIQHFITPLNNLIAFGIAVLHSLKRLGWKHAVTLIVLSFAISLLFESVGVATGLVYGPYHYTDMLGVKFLGLVPLIIPLTWYMMSYPAYVISERLVPVMKNVWLWRLLVAGSAAVVMTAWDLVIDPILVAAGHWVWEVQGAYFGVPAQNYWGWWLTVFVTFLVFLAIGRVQPAASQTPPRFDRLAMLVYIITGGVSVINAFIIDLAGPALAGLFAMLPWAALGWLSTNNKEKMLSQAQ